MNLPRRLIVPLIVAVILLVAGGIAIWTTRSQSQKFSGPPEKIRLGTVPAELSSLIWVAEDRGYFAENGLDVTINLYESGFVASKDLIAGKLEIVTVGDFVFAGQAFERDDLRLLAAIDMYDSNRVIARRDHGIGQLADLKGKRIGVVRGSQAEFCLGRLLTLNSINFQDVQAVDLSPSQQAEAARNGEIDAAIVWEPFAQNIMNVLGSNAVSLPGQSGQDLYWLLTCKEEIIKKRPVIVQRLLAAMLSAELFVTTSEAQAKAIVARRLGFDTSHLKATWRYNRFEVTLSRPLMLTMEDQAKWLISTGRTDKTKVPNFLNFVHLNGLKAVKPEAVSIIHWEGPDDH